MRLIDHGKYKSRLEKTNATYLKDKDYPFFYEPKEGRIKYVIPASIHTYTPDFWIPKKDGSWIVVETKGIWEYTDRLKHVWIKTQYPRLDLRFVFSNSRTKTSKGAKQTYADICEGRGRGVFRGLKWQYADKRIPEAWLNE
jgi:hypothetical protein